MPRYDKQTWRPGRTGGTPISAARLQHIEDGLEAIDLALDNVQMGGDTTYVPVPGESAYETWQAEGNTGTKADFLASLRGQDGLDGVDGVDGIDGIDGVDGVDGQDGADAFLDPRTGGVYMAAADEDVTLLDPPLPPNTLVVRLPA